MATSSNYVLLVDDDAEIRDTFAAALAMHGYDCATAQDGAAALDYLHEHREPPCVVFLDLMMPNVNGVEFRQAQVAEPALAEIPVVVLTGAPTITRDPVLAGLDVLVKPVALRTILDHVQRHCIVTR